MIRKKTLRLLLCDYQRTARYYTIYRTFKCLSSDDFTTILRLSAGINYDYSSRDAATIADLYWLSDESPKREAATAVNGSAPPACCRVCPLPLLLDCTAAGWSMPDRRRVDPYTGCKLDALTRRRWHGLRYAAPLGMDPQQGRTPSPLYTLL